MFGLVHATQILVHRWDPEQGFWHSFADRLNHSLVSSVAQAEATVHFDYVSSINIHASFIIRVVLESFYLQIS